MRKIIARSLFGLLGFMLFGCTSADNEMAGGNLQAINHTLKGINWMSVNGYRADGGGGRSCCIVMPIKWRPGLKANVEWEVDPDPLAKMPSVTSAEFRDVYAEHARNYKIHSVVVDIPEWLGTERCGLSVHFLVCNQVRVTTSCWASYSENYPINDPLEMEEPAVCLK